MAAIKLPFYFKNIVKFLRNKIWMFVFRNNTFCMRICFVLFFIFFISANSFSQTIKRETMNETGLGGKKIFANIQSNIFNDFVWIEPNFTAKRINFFEQIYYFEMIGLSFQITQIDTNMMELKGSGTAILIDKKKSANDIYYDKNILKTKAIENQKWVAHLNIETKTIPVKHLTPGSANNYYTTFESHAIAKTQWKWETTTDSVLNIPSYFYYQFDLNDGRTIFVYEVKNNAGKNEYFIQNASYLDATDDQGIEYILLDNDCNGIYTDASDNFFLKTWNPNLKESNFKNIKFAKENSWYDYSFFQNNFLIPYFHERKLNFENIIKNYAGVSKTGIVTFKNIPRKSTLLINKTYYPIRKGKNKFDCDYGIYKATISRTGYVDFENIFTINDNNPLEEIFYQKTSEAGTLQINNIYETDFYVTIKNANGFVKTFHNISKIEVPTGINELTIYFNGYQIAHQFLIKQKEIFEFDFENEIKKLVK